ncbi:hypothetical protein [uncultured Cellulomonas sp.]|nr:hypothetical protein [uncultured Cellulomonas sp.]
MGAGTLTDTQVDGLTRRGLRLAQGKEAWEGELVEDQDDDEDEEVDDER